MSTLTTNYAIRYIPPGTRELDDGGVFATRESVNSPILAAKLNTGGVNQRWHLELVKGGGNTYHISQPTDPKAHTGPVLSGFGIDPTGTHVVESTNMAEFAFTQVDPTNNIFIMSAPKHQFGSANDLSVSANGELVIERIGSGATKETLPQWQLIPVQFVPPGTTFPYSGGDYATRTALNSPILASPLSSTDTVDQVWQVQPVDGTTDTYRITQPTDPNIHIGPVIGGFSLDSSGSNVILSTSILKWVLTVVDPTNNVYIISEPNHPIGSINDLTVSDGQLVIVTEAIGGNKDPLPQWQFIGIDDLD